MIVINSKIIQFDFWREELHRPMRRRRRDNNASYRKRATEVASGYARGSVRNGTELGVIPEWIRALGLSIVRA